MTTNIIPQPNSIPELVRIRDNESIERIDTSKTVCAVIYSPENMDKKNLKRPTTNKQEAEANRQLDFFELLQI